MKRDLRALARDRYDVIVVGGGIFGVCLAWDAVCRGLSVAIVERGDFSNATSANSFKIVHGGIRYIQHGDIRRVRESSRERRALLRVAPHLVEPLPIVIPTYGHGMNGKEVLRAGVLMYDLAAFDRNRGITDPARQIPWARSLSRREFAARFPGFRTEGLTGGVLFHDAQMYNPPRIALSFVRASVEAGARAANYAETTGYLRDGDRVTGVVVRDCLDGTEHELKGDLVINAAGPWTEGLLSTLGIQFDPQLTFSRDACFVVKRKLVDCSIAILAATKDPDAILSRSHRHLFLAPWRDYTLIGTWHVVHEGDPDDFTVTRADLEAFIEEVNASQPSLNLTIEDVSMWNAGLVLFGDNQVDETNLSYGKRSSVTDHALTDSVEGLVSVVGVRYTTARGIAEKTIGLALDKLGRQAPPSRTDERPVYGGDITDFESLVQETERTLGDQLQPHLIRPLVHNYGSKFGEVVKYTENDPSLAEPIGSTTSIRAEVVHAVREEMAVKLGDVVFRRTDIGTGECPGSTVIEDCARIMAEELGWDSERIRMELEEVTRRFPQLEHVSP